MWWPSGEDFREDQEGRYAADEWEDRIGGFVATREEVTSDEIYQHLKIDPRDQDNGTRARLAAVMSRAGFASVRRRDGGRGSRQYRVWVREGGDV